MPNTVYFATNRNADRQRDPTDFGASFSRDGLSNLRFGQATLSGRRGSEIRIDVEPESLAKAAGEQVLGSQQLFESLRRRMQTLHTDTIVFIHGYNTSFHEALRCGAALQAKLKALPHQMVVFSWPSDASLMPFAAYRSDRHDAAASGLAFARGFCKLYDFLRHGSAEQLCQQRIHLIAHSMGNYVLRQALQEFRKLSGGRLPKIFAQLLLMAPDEDDDTFEHDHKMQPLPGLAQGVHVYFNRGDAALSVSDHTKGNPARLGADGARQPRNVPGKVHLVDCSAVLSGPLEHNYYLSDARVQSDMVQVLRGVAPETIRKRAYSPHDNTFRLRA